MVVSIRGKGGTDEMGELLMMGGKQVSVEEDGLNIADGIHCEVHYEQRFQFMCRLNLNNVPRPLVCYGSDCSTHSSSSLHHECHSTEAMQTISI